MVLLKYCTRCKCLESHNYIDLPKWNTFGEIARVTKCIRCKLEESEVLV